MDVCATMAETSVLKYIALCSCTSRSQELLACKTDRRVLALEGSSLSVKAKDPELYADTSSALALRNALFRRGVCLEMAGLASFLEHDNLGFLPDGKMGVRSTLCLASNQGATWITWPHYLRHQSFIQS